MDEQKIVEGSRLLLEGLGVDLKDGNFTTTPERMLKVYKELFAPPDTEWPVFEEEYTDIVVMTGVEFYTLCPHHMLPVQLTAAVAYIPNSQVIGASKLIRMMYDANRQPMTQEKLTSAIIDRIDHLTGATSQGAGVLLKGAHGCFAIRGVRQPCARMVTAKFSGIFLEEQYLQDRFYHLVNGR